MSQSPPAGYRVRVDGHLGEQWTAALGGWTLQLDPDGTTTLTAGADQAQLHGLLAVLRDLNATLLSVSPVDEERAGGPASVSSCAERSRASRTPR